MAFTLRSSGSLIATAGANPLHAGSLSFPSHESAADQSISPFQPDALALALPYSTDVNTSVTIPAVKSNNWATKEDWAVHRSLIKQHYHDENKPLAEVMHFMEREHGFRATVKMYKTHIKQWGLDKKNKEFEMKAIVRKHKQRSDQGKASIIRVRGQFRDFADVVRYWNRKGVSVDDIITRQTASRTPEAIDVFTPIPSPIRTPQVLAIPERILRCIHDYFNGSFESGLWVKTEPTSHCYSIEEIDHEANGREELYMQCYIACSYFRRNLFHEAGQTLLVATAKIKEVLLVEDPLSILDLLELLSYIRNEKRDEIASIILRQISAMGKVLLGIEHPLSRFSEYLGCVPASDFDDVAARCMEDMTDQLKSIVGPLHRSTIYFRRAFIRQKHRGGSVRIQMLQELLSECENILQPYDARVLTTRTCLADELRFEGYLAEAKTLIQRNLDCAQHSSTMTAGSYNQEEDLYILANCQYGLGEVVLGIATLHQVIDLDLSSTSFQTGQVPQYLLLLGEWYLEQGLWDSAVQIREWRVEMLESMVKD